MDPNKRNFISGSELDRVLHEISDYESDLSSLFSSDEGSVYNPMNDGNDSDSDVSFNDDQDQQYMDIDDMFSDPDDPVEPQDMNEGGNPDEESDTEEAVEGMPNQLQIDPNVLFVVNAVHEKYQESEGLWIDSQNIPQPQNFTGREEVHIHTNNPIEVFNHFFDENILENIVVWTNKRAARFRGTPLPKQSILNSWTDVTQDELKKFFGLSILMGNINFPTLKHYWSLDPLYHHPIFGLTMSRNRFECILQCICFYDSDVVQAQNRMHKIDQVLKPILENANKVYSPGKFLSLDEAMVLFRGRLIFRQYIKSKAHKYGIKLYELCTPDGFILNIIIYGGKGTVQDDEKGHTYNVVMKLMKDFLKKGHTVFLDNFYTSVVLAESLLQEQTSMCGTLRSDRTGNPKAVVQAKLQPGETISRQNGDITVMKWRDKRYVLTISTTNGPEMQEVQNKRGVVKNKPSMVVEYNKGMGGIDRADQMISYYSSPRKSLRWYMKIFYHLLDVTLWNACYTNSKLNGKMTYLEFRNLIIKSYIEVVPVARNPRAVHSRKESHLPSKVPKRVRCYNCRTQHKKRTDTFFVCSNCKDSKDKPIGLCVPKCFGEFHE